MIVTIVSLEVQLEPELELSWVKCRRWAAVIFAARTLVVGIYSSEEGICRSLVKAIEQVKALGNQIKAKTFAKAEPLG